MQAYLADSSSTTGVTLQEVPAPPAAPGVAVVAVSAASLNRGEVMHVRSGGFIPDGGRVGWDVAGIVVRAATDGTGPVEGTRVFGWCEERGTWADQVAVPIEHLAEAPEGLSLVDASTLGVAALTAHAAVHSCRRPLAGASVAITGATGGVGSFALQLAALAGARVIASVRSQSDDAVVRAAAGSPLAVEVGLDPLAAPLDLVVDSVGGTLLTSALVRVAPSGVVVTLGRTSQEESVLPSGWFLKGARLEGLTIGRAFPEPGSAGSALAEMASLVVNGRLHTSVEWVLPASELSEAMDLLLDRRARGKVVVTWSAGDW